MVEFRRALFADHSASLGLQEVLTQGGAPKQSGPARLRHAFSPGDWPLALKMTLAMLVTALLPMLITAGYNLRGSLEAVSAGELRYVEQMAHSTAGRVGQLINHSRHFARSLGTDDDFAVFLAEPTEDGKSVVREKLERLTQANPDVQLIILMDAAGVAIVSSDPAVMGRNFAFRQYFKEAIAGRSFASGLVVAMPTLPDAEARFAPWLTAKVLLKAAAPVTPNVPATVALPAKVARTPAEPIVSAWLRLIAPLTTRSVDTLTWFI